MNDKQRTYPSVLDRTVANVLRGWRRISKQANARSLKLKPDLPDSDYGTLRTRISDCLESRGGEVSSRARAADLGRAYLELSDAGRCRFFLLLANEFGLDQRKLKAAASHYLEQADDAERDRSVAALRSSLTPPWVKLLHQFNALPSGVKFLVDLRNDLERFREQNAELATLAQDLKQLLASWFDIGFLELKRITWNEPASLLEKIIAYEAVHEITSWDDLKHRLHSDRRCYAFFHPNMPDEPLVFVQVALVNGTADNIQELLDDSAPEEDPDTANTAIFYSISNTQPGLRGINLGDFLIKRVVDDLSLRLPNVKTFATLSPIPGFTQFVEGTVHSDPSGLLKKDETALLESVFEQRDSPWDQSPDLMEKARPVVTRLCAHYLLQEKNGKRARNRVANFHLSNGARVQRLNWLADTSEQGMRNSLGMMVNYLYKLSHIEHNHEAYVGQGEIASSSSVRNLIR